MSRPWYVAPALDTLRDEINRAHPGRDRSSDGAIGDAAHAARKSDHNPDPKTGVVRARDFDVDGIPVRELLTELERDDRTGLLIYDHRYWTRGHGWRPYTGINPHTGHFHISVRPGTQYENDTRPWLQEDNLMPALTDAEQRELLEGVRQARDYLGARGGINTKTENTVGYRVRDIQLALTGFIPAAMSQLRAGTDPKAVAAAVVAAVPNDLAQDVIDALSARLARKESTS